MLPHRKAPAAVSAAVLALLGTGVSGCSDSDGTTGTRPQLKDTAPRTTTAYTASRPGSGTPSAADMEMTAGRLRQRAKALGLEDTVISVDGTVVTIAGPRASSAGLRRIAATAELEFRPVLDPSAAEQNGLKEAYDSRDCALDARPTPSLPDRPVVSCDRSAHQKYLLGPAGLGGTSVDSASAELTTTGSGWVVDLSFTPSGSAKFAQVTGELAQQTQPANQFAIVVDGDVVSAPAVMSAITGGKAQITGDFSKAEAQALAAAITSGALPVQLTPRDGGRS
jgi:preprotein translocase subunit SecD